MKHYYISYAYFVEETIGMGVFFSTSAQPVGADCFESWMEYVKTCNPGATSVIILSFNEVSTKEYNALDQYLRELKAKDYNLH